MITRTIGSSGADHVDINAWVAWVQANEVSGGNLIDDQTGAVKAVGFSPTAAQTISGWAPGGSGYTTTLTANTGDSFKDNANARTNALAYNTSNGAFIAMSSSGVVIAQVNKFRLTYLQLKTTASYGRAVKINTGTITDCIVDGNIIEATLADGGTVELASTIDGIIFRNNTILADRGSSGTCGIDFNSACQTTAAQLSDNTFWTNASPTQGAVNAGTYGKITAKGNVFLNNVTCAMRVRDANATGSNNATEMSSWSGTGFGAGTLTGLTASQLSISNTNEITSGGSTPTDFRLKAGGTALQGTGVTISGVTTDISGFSRAAGSEDIGAWQKTAGGSLIWFGNLQQGQSQPLSERVIPVAA